MLRIEIKNIQGISHCIFDISAQSPNIQCIVGKNASGKTTLIRAIANIAISDIFRRQCTRHIFDENSSQISYTLSDGQHYSYLYNKILKSLDCKGKIPPDHIINQFCIESAFPYGNRYSHIQKIRTKDKNIKIQISQKEYKKPSKLINFLNSIYNTNKFDKLKETIVDKLSVCFFLRGTNRYIREDHFSSGEFFLINLYRAFQNPSKKIILIDEIDSALDAEAQVNLIQYLRDLSEKEDKKIIFTTHSLALMKTLKKQELLYLSNTKKEVTIKPQSYYYIKSLLFGFKGFDKYILVEDNLTCDFIERLIRKKISNCFYKYKILPVGTANSTNALYEKNKNDNFLSNPSNVIVILDGDQKSEKFKNSHYFLPFDDIEKYTYNLYTNTPSALDDLLDKDFQFIPKENINPSKNAKNFYKTLTNYKDISPALIFDFILDQEICEDLIQELKMFLA